MTLRFFSAVVAAAMLLAASTTAAQADTVVYDNFTSHDLSTEVGGDRSYSAIFRSDVDQTINRIGARLALPLADELKFVLFDLGDGDTPAVGGVVFSQIKSFDADPRFAYRYSDLFSFSFAADHWYAVGVIAALDGAMISLDGANPVTPGAGFTALPNVNFTFDNFDSPSIVGSSCCNMHYQLLRAEAVPEPGAWALMILGFGTAGAALRRRPMARAVPT